MAAYWIAHVTVHDSEKYQAYMELAKEVFPRFGAKFIARSEEPINLEGETYARHVVILFKDQKTALECYHSPEYQNARKKRLEAAEVMVTIIPGL